MKERKGEKRKCNWMKKEGRRNEKKECEDRKEGKGGKAGQ